MRVMLRNNCAGHLVVYVPKKDLEEEVVSQADVEGDRVLTLANGWELAVSGWTDSLKLPQTVEAKRLN